MLLSLVCRALRKTTVLCFSLLRSKAAMVADGGVGLGVMVKSGLVVVWSQEGGATGLAVGWVEERSATLFSMV